MKLTVTTLIAALIASTAAVVLAQRPDGDGDRPRRGGGEERQRGQRGGPGGGRADFFSRLPLYKALDANEDGELSKEEIENASVALLKLDKNEDGKLSRDEITPSFSGRTRGGANAGGRTRGGGGDGGRPQRPRRPDTEKASDDNKKEDSDS